MKPFIRWILFFCVPLFTGIHVSAQCEPDTTCLDVNETVAFCPKIMPEAIIGEPYEAVLTVVPPSEFQLGETRLQVAYLEIDSVSNFPPGISYAVNADRFYPDTAYCVLMSGTPTQTGDFTLELYVTPYINYPLLGTLKGPQAVDNTSITIKVKGVTGVDLSEARHLEVFQNVPNPFSQSTRIGFYSPVRNKIDLEIYNILGELIHKESSVVNPGEHFFRFDGSELLPGSYLYLVRSDNSYLTRKLIKTR